MHARSRTHTQRRCWHTAPLESAVGCVLEKPLTAAAAPIVAAAAVADAMAVAAGFAKAATVAGAAAAAAAAPPGAHSRRSRE
eukprot:2481857-Prymnesium_polylepis.1